MADPQLGAGELAVDPSKSVFINCPFDTEYAPLFDAIVFATVCCGFFPRTALETSHVSEPRIQRIARAIFSSKYSIHDLSRCKGEGSDNFARFNMPLELGMAMARRFVDPEHEWLLLVPPGGDYLRFASDLAAYDPSVHDGSKTDVMMAVTSWLAMHADSMQPIKPDAMLQALPDFEARKRALELSWHDQAPWRFVVSAAALEVAKELV